jgi:CRP/FNR family transcriptional regulator, cyclic AMP receptor protein
VALRRSRRPADPPAACASARVIQFRVDRQPNILARLDNAQRRRVMAVGVPLHLRENEMLFAQGVRHNGVFLIESGLIRTYYVSPAGREITLAYWQPGNIVGTPQVVGPGVHMWSGVAVHETRAVGFRGEDLGNLMRDIPALAIGVVEALEFKGKCLSALVQMLGTRSVSERLATLLCNLADIHGVPERDGVAIGPPFTHEAFAQMIGASRQWVTITLDRFQNENLIRVGRRRTVILRPDVLRTHRSGGESVVAI